MEKAVCVLCVVGTLTGCHRTPLAATNTDAGDQLPPVSPACPECDEHAECDRADEVVICTCRAGFTRWASRSGRTASTDLGERDRRDR